MDLKRVRLSSSLIALGSLFHSDGAAAVKALSPSVFFVSVDGGTNKSYDDSETSFDFIVNFVNFPLTLSSRPGFSAMCGWDGMGVGGGGRVGFCPLHNENTSAMTLRLGGEIVRPQRSL